MSDKIFMKEITLPIVETGENETYSFVQTDADLETAGDAADAKAVGDELTNLKQDLQEFPNGNYPNMTAGNAEQLVSTVFVEDEVPYNFRTSGGSADIGDREYDEIVGVSMPINQLVNNGDFSNGTANWAQWETSLSASSNILTATTTVKSTGAQFYESIAPIVVGHKYYARAELKPSVNTTKTILGYSSTPYVIKQSALTSGVWNTLENIVTTTFEAQSLRVFVDNGTAQEIGMTIQAKNIMLFDLTLLLGTAIADYVYGLEQSTAGSGVSWLKHHFPKIFDSGYIPYNAGEMQSVSGLSAHKMTGFNQWDEVWELGYYSSTNGAYLSRDNGICSKRDKPIRILPNTVYCLTVNYGSTLTTGVCFYDADDNFISFEAVYSNDPTFTTPNGARYMRFYLNNSYGNTYKNDICINLHCDGERDGEYEEYKEYVYPLDDSVVLRGKLELDSNNNLRANGDRYLPDGTVQRRYGVVDLGTLIWNQTSAGYFYSTSINNLAKKGSQASEYDHIRCVLYVAQNVASLNSLPDKAMSVDSGGNIQIHDSAYSTSEAFKSAMSGAYLLYELATPTTETAEPYQTPQIVDDWGTEEYVSTSLVPVGHDTKYAPNLRAKLEMAPESPAGNGDYIVRQTNGENEYVALGSTTTIQNILDRLTALENA